MSCPPAIKDPLRVLVVDDNRDQADSTALLVRCWGHDVRVAYDGGPALEAACTYQPHVLLLDIGMPALDGYSLARVLRREAGLREAVLVAVTGYADEAHRRQGEEAGFDHYLVKPVEAGELQRVLAVARRTRDLGVARSDTLRATDTARLRSRQEAAPNVVSPSPVAAEERRPKEGSRACS